MKKIIVIIGIIFLSIILTACEQNQKSILGFWHLELENNELCNYNFFELREVEERYIFLLDESGNPKGRIATFFEHQTNYRVISLPANWGVPRGLIGFARIYREKGIIQWTNNQMITTRYILKN